MKTQFRVNEASMLSNGSIMISGSIIAGPRLVIGQEGAMTTTHGSMKVIVVGTGVMDPNLAPSDRQGILVKLVEGDVKKLKGVALEFGEYDETEG